jgi:hypothetical protein
MPPKSTFSAHYMVSGILVSVWRVQSNRFLRSQIPSEIANSKAQLFSTNLGLDNTETKLWFQRVLFWTHLTKANHVGSSKTLPKHQRLLDCIKVRAVSCEYFYSLATTHGIQQYQIVVAEHLIAISFGEVLPGICKPGDSCLPDGKS